MPTCDKHPVTVKKYKGSLEELAKDLENLRYDKFCELLDYLILAYDDRAEIDARAGRTVLSSRLYNTATSLVAVRRHVNDVWDVCRSKMDTSEEK